MKRIVILTALAAALALALLLSWGSRLPDVEIRYAPRQTQGGRLFPGHALGQGFVCERYGLHAIDVALVPEGDVAATAIELALRARTPDGPVLRRVRLEPAQLPTSDGWAHFEFEPLLDSAGAAYYFELSSAAPTQHSPWIRYRGLSQPERAWGDRVVPGRVHEGELKEAQLHHAGLCALAFAFDGVDAAAGPAYLTLFDAASGAELRSADLLPRTPHAVGWGFFSFEPLLTSRFASLRWRLELPPGGRAVGDAVGLSLIAFYAAGSPEPSVLGMTAHGAPLADRDLVFRAWSDDGASLILARLAARGGLRLALAALFSVAATVALFALVRRALASES